MLKSDRITETWLATTCRAWSEAPNSYRSISTLLTTPRLAELWQAPAIYGRKHQHVLKLNSGWKPPGNVPEISRGSPKFGEPQFAVSGRELQYLLESDVKFQIFRPWLNYPKCQSGWLKFGESAELSTEFTHMY